LVLDEKSRIRIYFKCHRSTTLFAVLVIPDADSPPDPDFGSSSRDLMTKNWENHSIRPPLRVFKLQEKPPALLRECTMGSDPL
jgi:hypothetical protein